MSFIDGNGAILREIRRQREVAAMVVFMTGYRAERLRYLFAYPMTPLVGVS